jgi:hypothetical protein
MSKNKFNYFILQRGHAWTEILLGSLFLILLSVNSLRGYQLLQENKIVQLHYLLNQISSAWYEFQDKYQGGLPGDFAFAQSSIDSSLQNGNGNRLIDTDMERGQVWAHLAATGLLKGVMNHPITSTAVSSTQPCPRALCPDNGFGQGLLISARDNHSNALFAGKGIELSTLALLDQQIDDGLPKSGKIQLTADSSIDCFEDQHYAQTDITHCLAFVPLL